MRQTKNGSNRLPDYKIMSILSYAVLYHTYILVSAAVTENKLATNEVAKDRQTLLCLSLGIHD